MPNIFIIMGDEKTKKSSTIRALTGIYQMRSYDVGTQNGEINVFIHPSSLQETDTSSQEFINKHTTKENILVSLWIRDKRGRDDYFPVGIEYIRNFIDAGWNISQIVGLGVDNIPNLSQNTPQPHYILNSRNLPSNTIASQIREWWRWL